MTHRTKTSHAPMYCIHCKNTFKIDGVPLNLLPTCPHCDTQMKAYDLHQGALILMGSAMLQVRRASGLVNELDGDSPAGRETNAILKGLDAMLGSLLSVYGDDLALNEFDDEYTNAIDYNQSINLTKKLSMKIPVGKVTRF